MAGTVKGITIEFRGETSSLEKSLYKIDEKTKDIDKELKQVNKDLKFNPKSVELWKQKQSLLTEKIEQTQDRLKTLKEAQAKMDADGVDKNSKEYQKLRREIIETESKLKTFKGQLKKIGNAKLTALGQQFKAVGDKMKSVGKTLTTKVSAPLAALGTYTAYKFAEVDKIMTLTNKTMANTAEEAELLNQAMKTAAANSTYGMTDAATATLNFARAGLSAEQAAATLAPAMNLAAGEGGNLDTVSSGLVATINGFQDSFDNAAIYADVFANACNNTALDVDSLSNAMSVAAPIFSAAGYSVQDAALYMGIMANNGIEASKAANSLKTGLARLISPSKQGSEMMDRLGISVTNADGSMKDTITIQKELHDTFMQLSESEQIAAASAIFGKNQMAPWLALINTAPDSVAELNKQLGTTGTTGEMAEAMMSGFAGSLEKIKSGIDVAATSLGEALAPMIQTVAEWIQKAVDWFNALDPKTKSIIATVGVIVAALGPVLVIVGSIISAIGTILPLLGTVVAAAGPIIAIVAGVIAIMVVLYKNQDKIMAKMREVWENIKTTVSNAVNAVKAKIDAIKTAFVNTWDTIKTKTVSVWNAIKDAITKPIETAKNIIKDIVGKIKSFFQFKITLPHIKLPHFSIKPEGWKLGDLLKGKIPSLGIDWYAKGGVFTNPSVIGVGEAGDEAVLPLDTFWRKMDRMADAVTANSGGVVINVYPSAGMNVNQLAAEIERRLVQVQKQRQSAWT